MPAAGPRIPVKVKGSKSDARGITAVGADALRVGCISLETPYAVEEDAVVIHARLGSAHLDLRHNRNLGVRRIQIDLRRHSISYCGFKYVYVYVF